MIALIQRVSEASVTVESQIVGKIGAGILALIGFERGDEMDDVSRLLTRTLEWTLVFGILDFVFDAQGQVNQEFLRSDRWR